MSYVRAVDPLPLQSADWNALHTFYERLAAGALVTTRCEDCGRTAWPPRAFCTACASIRYTWIELPREGAVHAFTVQDTGLPPGFPGPRIFAIVAVDGHRIFTVLVDTDPAVVRIGQRVTLAPLRVADGPRGSARWLVAFRGEPGWVS